MWWGLDSKLPFSVDALPKQLPLPSPNSCRVKGTKRNQNVKLGHVSSNLEWTWHVVLLPLHSQTLTECFKMAACPTHNLYHHSQRVPPDCQSIETSKFQDLNLVPSSFFETNRCILQASLNTWLPRILPTNLVVRIDLEGWGFTTQAATNLWWLAMWSWDRLFSH